MPKPEKKRALVGFEAINRYWDKTNSSMAAKILPGEYYVTSTDEIITTVLGSCISACIWDQGRGIGGMNHFMLPSNESGGWGGSDLVSTATRYGNHAMEQMINSILKHGGRRGRLSVKIFGGGKIISSMSDVGKKNIKFVEDYINNEELTLLAEDVGGGQARKVIFYPKTGRARVKRLKNLHNNTVLQRDRNYQDTIVDEPFEGTVELF
ncbi:MAG: chemoreceptor glutamine deamidase CheD [Gammaproteobacteria bacterium]|nr:chemoreceptor glutamine deamidase CheD [Gammaproteobacteria bacterium]